MSTNGKEMPPLELAPAPRYVELLYLVRMVFSSLVGFWRTV